MSEPWEVWDKEHVANLVEKGWANEDKIRRGPIIDEILKSTEGKSVLDVGCGVGRYAHFYREMPVAYMGMDSSEEMLGVARKRYPELPLFHGSAFDLSEFPEADTVIATAVLIHLPESSKALGEMWSRTKKILMVTVLLGDGSTQKRHEYGWGKGAVSEFPEGKDIIYRSETKEEFEALIDSLPAVRMYSAKPIQQIVLYKIYR